MTSANKALLLSGLSVILCWWFGVIGLGLSVWSLLVLRKQPLKSAETLYFFGYSNRQYTMLLMLIGFTFSMVFTVVYFVAVINGTFVRW
ncbi:MAG: hypothetical protein M3Q97_03710 [Bacteroidota bacterium]|nr:hypothetical protein [Bacteroidota bacterium]